MPRSMLLLPAVALLFASCGKQAMTLPADPVERAATCGVIAAAKAREGAGTVKGALGFEQQGGIVHYALLAGASDKSFANDKAAAAVRRMSELQEEITAGKWQELITPCREAFPETDPAKPVTLPADPLEARLACYMLGDFLANSMQRQDASFGDQLSRYDALKRRVDQKVAAGLAARGAAKGDALRQARQEALAVAARLGPPTKVMTACLAKYS